MTITLFNFQFIKNSHQMAALNVRVFDWTNKCGCAMMENKHFDFEPCICKASQAFEDSLIQYFNPEKPKNSHKFSV